MGLQDKKERLIKNLIHEGYLRSPEVIEAMRKVPREDFILPFHRKHAYSDTPLPIEGGQTISAPHMVVMMTELLELKRGHRVLDVGTGSGYHAAVMSEIVGPEGMIYGIERVPELVEMARENLKEYENVEVVLGDGSLGLPEKAPFDRILVACGAPDVPPALFEQLKEGGRMVIPVGSREQRLLLVRKMDGRMVENFHGYCVFVPMIGEQGFRR